MVTQPEAHTKVINLTTSNNIKQHQTTRTTCSVSDFALCLIRLLSLRGQRSCEVHPGHEKPTAGVERERHSPQLLAVTQGQKLSEATARLKM